MLHRFACSLLLLAGATAAQGWSITAISPTGGVAAGQLTSSFAPPVNVNSTLSSGPFTTGVFLSADAVLGASHANSSAEWASPFPGQVAPLGFRVFVFARAIVSPPAGPNQVAATTTLDADALFVLQAPSPGGGRVVLTYLGQQSEVLSHAAVMDVDVGADGTIEMAATSHDPFARMMELPLQIAASGTPIRIHITANANWAATHPNTSVQTVSLEVTAQYFPDQAAVGHFDATGATVDLAGFHALDDRLTLVLPSQSVGAIVFGSQPMVAPVVGFPLVTQLVSFDAFALGRVLLLAMPPLPPGTRIYAQGFVLEPSGIMRSSNSLRAWWP